MAISSAEIKRQILIASDKSGIKKKIQQALENQTMTEGEIIETGNALKEVANMKGWNYIEAFMLRRMDIVGLVFGEEDSMPQKGIARGYMELMHYIDQTISMRDEIIERERTKDEKGKAPEGKK